MLTVNSDFAIDFSVPSLYRITVSACMIPGKLPEHPSPFSLKETLGARSFTHLQALTVTVVELKPIGKDVLSSLFFQEFDGTEPAIALTVFYQDLQ